MVREVTVSGTVTPEDGSRSAFEASSGDGGWMQWGAGNERLGRTVDLVEAIHQAVVETADSTGGE